MLNRSILTELAALEARFEAGCLVCIDLIDRYVTATDHFYCLIRGCGSLYAWYVFLKTAGSFINLDDVVF